MATYELATTEYITVQDVRFAYRQFGIPSGVPLVFFMHFRGTMDHWDPALINPIAAARPVLLIDNAGVGRSAGEIPKKYKLWAQNYIDVILALGLTQVDVLGFSMGGCVAQMVALNAPTLVRKVVLCGTIPSTGPGVVRADIGPFNHLSAATTDEEHRVAFLETMFNTSPRSRAAGEAAWRRITEARPDRCRHVDLAGARRQGIAFAKFMDPKQAADASYERFQELQLPVLIANGKSSHTSPDISPSPA
ncbi:alpha/beta hydrolase fold domain-containing protein [Sarocladium implicatum]|nr:alpha/beta hydrolase fold domain-containing protein [Sarocladium implicatum]